MPLALDARVGNERTQFASQVPQDYCQLLVEAGFTHTDSVDFYEGLLSGYATALAIIQQMPVEQAKAIIGSCVAHLAKRLS